MLVIREMNLNFMVSIFRRTFPSWPNKAGLKYQSIHSCRPERQGNEPFKVGKLAIVKSLSHPPFKTGAGNWLLIPQLGHNI